MGKREIAIGIAVAAVIAGLVALTLAQREDYEPASAPEPRADRTDRSHPSGASDDEPEPEAVPEAASPPAAQQEPIAAAEEDRGEVPGCDHPLVPSMAGSWRRYRWAQSHTDFDGQGELRIEALRARELEGGDIEVEWTARMTAGPGTEPASARFRTRCSEQGGAEEPWFGIVDLASGRELVRTPDRWRWPATLREELAFEGTAAFLLSRAEVRELGAEFERTVERATRRHRVGAREDVDVPAGHFSAWRVDYEEQRALGGHVRTGSGTLWIAPGEGLVRSRAVTGRGGVETIELVASGED